MISFGILIKGNTVFILVLHNEKEIAAVNINGAQMLKENLARTIEEAVAIKKTKEK